MGLGAASVPVLVRCPLADKMPLPSSIFAPPTWGAASPFRGRGPVTPLPSRVPHLQLRAGFLNVGTTDSWGRQLSVMVAALGLVGCLTASLASTCYMLVALTQ